MKVYRNKSGEPKKLNKKMWISIGVSLALIAAAVAITLSLTLGGATPVIPGEKVPVDGVPVYVMPVDSYEVGKTFSDDKLVRYYTSNWYETHEGLDLLVESGAEVKAIYDGNVLSIEANTSMEGTVIKIQHTGGLVSVYKGLASAVEVSVGDAVKAGDVIGTVGKMPIESREYQQAHLHLEVLKDGSKVNPLDYLPEIGDK